jgi:hypothetical protein
MVRFIKKKLKRNMKIAGVRAQPGPQLAAALAGIELEDVPEQQHGEDHHQQKDQHGEGGNSERFARGLGIQEPHVRSIERLQPAQQTQKQHQPARKQGHSPPSRFAAKEHGQIIASAVSGQPSAISCQLSVVSG